MFPSACFKTGASSLLQGVRDLPEHFDSRKTVDQEFDRWAKTRVVKALVLAFNLCNRPIARKSNPGAKPTRALNVDKVFDADTRSSGPGVTSVIPPKATRKGENAMSRSIVRVTSSSASIAKLRTSAALRRGSDKRARNYRAAAQLIAAIIFLRTGLSEA